MSGLRSLPLKRKLIAIIMGTTVLALILAAASFFLAYDNLTFRKDLARSFETLVATLQGTTTGAYRLQRPRAGAADPGRPRAAAERERRRGLRCRGQPFSPPTRAAAPRRPPLGRPGSKAPAPPAPPTPWWCTASCFSATSLPLFVASRSRLPLQGLKDPQPAQKPRETDLGNRPAALRQHARLIPAPHSVVARYAWAWPTRSTTS